MKINYMIFMIYVVEEMEANLVIEKFSNSLVKDLLMFFDN